MKVGDEVKRGKPVMDVAAEFGVLLCYIIAAYARLIAIDLAYHCFVSSPGDLTVSRALAVSAVTFRVAGKRSL